MDNYYHFIKKTYGPMLIINKQVRNKSNSNVADYTSLVKKIYGQNYQDTELDDSDDANDYCKMISRIYFNGCYNVVGGSSIPKHIDFGEDFVDNKNENDNNNDNNNFIYKYSQLIKKTPYLDILADDPSVIMVKKYHLGQLKLFFSELIFLTKYHKDVNKVLYVGAAEGYHSVKMAELFPHLTFDLWDPRKFDPKLKEKKNVNLYNAFFDVAAANRYAAGGEKILFMCDMRTLEIGNLIKEGQIQEIEDLVDDDMKMQAQWARIINPVYAYLKFRLPWYSDHTKYLSGTIYLQPYGPAATEARLMTSNYSDTIRYDNKAYDDKLAYFNFKIRPKLDPNTNAKWTPIFDKYNLKNIWDNAISLYITDYYLRTVKNINSDESTGKLFMEIIDFHKEKYGSKYNVIFKS